ncbi:MAG: flagellar basal body-associated FliL family protein [Dehalococcoidia bacterium]|nr:flagellar basal body-associated FliL family protein [Dehalococcoidia bacterium]
MKDPKILAGGAVLLAALFMFYIKPNYVDAKDPAVYSQAQIVSAPRPTLTLEERVLNLSAPATSPKYVKLVIALEFADPQHHWVTLKGDALAAKNASFAAELEPESHRIWDVITRVVGSKTIEEVSTSEGREALKQDLVAALNDEIITEKVEDVFFVTFITQ